MTPTHWTLLRQQLRLELQRLNVRFDAAEDPLERKLVGGAVVAVMDVQMRMSRIVSAQKSGRKAMAAHARLRARRAA